jgi:hypothetical protein
MPKRQERLVQRRERIQQGRRICKPKIAGLIREVPTLKYLDISPGAFVDSEDDMSKFFSTSNRVILPDSPIIILKMDKIGMIFEYIRQKQGIHNQGWFYSRVIAATFLHGYDRQSLQESHPIVHSPFLMFFHDLHPFCPPRGRTNESCAQNRVVLAGLINRLLLHYNGEGPTPPVVQRGTGLPRCKALECRHRMSSR